MRLRLLRLLAVAVWLVNLLLCGVLVGAAFAVMDTDPNLESLAARLLFVPILAVFMGAVAGVLWCVWLLVDLFHQE